MSYDSATNRIIGSLYDANGNLTSPQSFGASYAYDVENRLSSAISANEFYAYAPDNKRIWKQMPGGNQEIYFYGINGQKLATYSLLYQSSPTQFVIATLDVNVYFGSNTIVSRGVTPLLDRLGSNRAGGSKYFPYGEEQQVTAGDRDKFGTYYRDQTTGLDYAQNRYYANTLGRFLTPDPYLGSDGPADPGSWNRYVYTRGDTINRYDPVGLQDEPAGETPTGCSGPDGSFNKTNCLPSIIGNLPKPALMAQLQPPQRTLGPGGPQDLQPGQIAGWQSALDALDSQDCADALGAVNGEAAKVALRGVPLYEDNFGAPTVTVSPDDPTLFAVNYQAGKTNGTSITFSTPTFMSPTAQIAGAPTGYNMLSVLVNEFNLKPSLTWQQFQAIFVLHELGHVLGGLSGDVGNASLSERNTGMVIQHCFPTLMAN